MKVFILYRWLKFRWMCRAATPFKAMHFISHTKERLAELLDLVMDQLVDGILIVNDQTRKVAYCNKKFIKMWNIPLSIVERGDDHELLNSVLSQVKDPQEFIEKVESLHGTDLSLKDEIHFNDGRLFARSSLATDGPSELRSRAWIFRDITKEKNHNLDSLTGCLNRREWDAKIENDQNSLYRSCFYCVAVVDLNDFKIINDDFGHEAGDRVLKRVGETLQRLIRSEQDSIFRTGGDEFCMIFESNSDTDIGPGISYRLSNELIASGLNASIGVCMSKSGDRLLDVFRKADAMMLASKKMQRNKDGFIHQSIPKVMRKTKTDQEIQMMADLAVAIKKNELSLAYQPIFDHKGAIVWIEALSRWTHDGKHISPSTFIPLAETSDLIHRIWDWSLDQVLKTLHEWQNDGINPVPISINFSAVQVEYYMNTHFSYTQQIKTACQHYNVCPSLLKIELTETSFLKDLLAAKELFEELSKLGVALCIDDFGTGFSSLSIMQALPINTIKIDGSFIKDVPANSSNTAITNGTISMANELGLEVCAECVESDDQIDYLGSHGCRYFQGYHKSIPLNKNEITTTVSTE